MTKLLAKAFEKAAKLPPKAQDSFAQFLLAELESEALWDSQFSKSQKMLSHMASEAVKADKRGKTRPLEEILDFDDY